MKFFKNSTSEKTAKLFNILISLWLKKCSKLKNACTENKIWRNDRKQLNNRHHIRQNSIFDIFFCSPFNSSFEILESVDKYKGGQIGGWTET